MTIGCDELILVPTTADLAEIDRIEALIAALPELDVPSPDGPSPDVPVPA